MAASRRALLMASPGALAAGGVGLIITGYMAVMPEGRASDLQTRLWCDSHK